MLLSKLRVLTLDCQATNGQLLEVGWSRTTASTSAAIDSRLVKSPEGPGLSKRVQRVTGLCDNDLASGESPRRLWRLLQDAAQHTDYTVIHFARFEEPFLRWLHHCYGAGNPYPFRILCTHRIVTRLLPELPRRGLRAAAGYFGHPMGELRRAADHVAATNVVWRSCVRLLGDEHGVRTVPELQEFLRAPAAPRRRSYPMPSRARSQLPDEPGVYRMLRGGADVLYVGKATSLRQRVRSYFAPGASHAEHTLEMLSQARDIDFTVTSSALEAALLEVEEIHRLRPPYNRALRPDERTLVFATARLDSFRETADAKHRVGPLPATEIWTEWAEAAQGLAAPLAIGMRLWRADEAGEVEFQLKAKVPTIEQRRDDILRRASHLVRRAHWFRLTQGATVSWGRRQVSTPDGPWDVVAYDRLVVLTSELRRLVREGQRPVLQTRRARLDAETVERLLRWV